MRLRTIAVASFAAACSVSWAGVLGGQESRPGQYHYVGIFGGGSWLALGSEDVRHGGGISYAYSHPDRGLNCYFGKGEAVFEVYMDWTHSHGANGDPINNAIALGGLLYAHYQAKRTYFDAGIGLQVQNRVSTDVPSEINSTPMVGAGLKMKSQGRDCLLGVRLLHVSNGGTKGNNPGQNQVFLTCTVRY